MPTKLTGLAFSEDGPGVARAIYCPRLTQEQIVAIPETPGLVGAIVFNIDTEELETYTAAGFWLPILTAESDINVETLTAQTVNATNADLTHIHSHDITNDAGITSVTVTAQTVNATTSLHSTAITNDNLITTLGLHVTSNVQVDGNVLCASGGVTGNLGVNGNLTAGNLATTGTLLVDGASTLQDVTIEGDLTVNGFGIFQDLNATNINALDIGANSIQPEALLYSLTNIDGSAPITVTLDVGAGGGAATYSITGSNLAGTFRLNTGTSPVVGVIATFALPSSLSSLMTGQGVMIMTPASSTTAIYEKNSKTYVSSGTGTTIGLFGSSQTALTASTTYIWNYVIIGNQLGT